ncbi:hypothetical protein MMC19_002081 [Ptychographa xylographoides]|nr:hypothetical protein [Ptychographa xylographoides]
MPQHLEQVNIDALDILDTLSSWLDNIKKDDYVLANADPILEKCIAKDLGKEIIPLWSKAVPKLYAISTPKRWVIYRSMAMAKVGTLRDQFIIPIQIPDSACIFVGSSSNLVTLTRGFAIFCASGIPAFLSAGVVFLVICE